MAENDVPEAIQAAAEVAELVSPTASDLWRVLHGYTPEAMAAAVAGLGGAAPGGSGLQISGPFMVPFALSENWNAPTVLGDIPSDTLVTYGCVIVVTNWDWDAGTLSLATAPATDLTDSSEIASGFNLQVAGWTGAKHQDGTDSTHIFFPFRTTVAQKLVCIAEGVTGTATSGSAEVYLETFSLV